MYHLKEWLTTSVVKRRAMFVTATEQFLLPTNEVKGWFNIPRRRTRSIIKWRGFGKRI